MRPVDRIASPSDVTFGRAPRLETAPASRAAPVAPSRSLVPLAGARRKDDRPLGRPAPGFVAQLIAAQTQVPQARERRRAEPGEAIAAYRARLGSAVFSGGVLARTA